MAEYQELVQTLTWLLTNRVQQKIQYTHGLLGDGNGRVRVSTTPGNPEVDYVYVRPDRFSNRTFKVFNKRIEGQDGDPVIIGELPWEPDLIQVIDMDWAAYADVGWGDDVTTTNRHGISHQWRDGAPGIDAFNVYRRQFGDLKTYPAVSGTLAVGVSPYSLDIFSNQYQWPGVQSFSLSGALPTSTGTARMVLVYWDPSSGTTGYLGVASGTLGSSSDATVLNRPVTPEGAIPSAFVKLRAGQSSVTEFDIWDAREPFRPGILFSTGSAAGLNAGLIPIVDNSGLYTGSTVEAALEQIGFDGARVSKLYQSDFGAVALSSDAAGDLTIAGTGTLTMPTNIIHAGDTDTLIGFDTNIFTAAAGGVSILTLQNREAVIVDVAETRWVDVPLINTGSESSHFRDNDGSYPAGWTETDAAEATNTNTLYSFWYLQGASTNTSWKYRKQTSTDLENDLGSGAAAQFLWGPIIFKDDPYTADVDYYFGVYRDNAGIDEDTFSRAHLQWDSAGSQWRIRGELKDSTSGTQTNGSWYVFSRPVDAAFFIVTGVVNNAAKTAASYYSLVNVPSTTVIANNWMTTLQFANPVTALTWGNIWLQTHQTRGAGGRDRFLIGAIDRLS